MWGLLEKGKELAANIDKQLNESIGVDGVPISATPSATASNSADDGQILNDAWNDDFDDDYDDDDGDGDVFDTAPVVKQVSEPPATAAIVKEQQVGAWDANEIQFDDSLQGDVPQQQVALPLPLPLPIAATESLMAAQLDPPAVPEEVAPPVLLVVQEPPVAPDGDMPTIAIAPEISESKTFEPAVETNHVAETPPVEEQEEDQEEEPDEERLVSDSDSPVVVEVPEEITSKESSPVVVDHQPPAEWEEHLYDDDDGDDDDDDDDDDDEDKQSAQPNDDDSATKAHPPATITIPTTSSPSNNNSISDAATGAMMREQHQQQQQAYELQLATLKSQLHQVTTTLEQRENQIAQKAQQMASMQTMFESEKESLHTKLRDTKEEAKRRIGNAKERVSAMETTLKASGKASEELMAKEETIDALRQEGQKLAMKQSSMEKAVRSAKGETRDLTHQLQDEQAQAKKALDKIAALEAEWKKTKDELTAARRGESHASKLELSFVTLQEETDKKEAANMSLQQQVKEYKAQCKELRKDMESSQKGAMIDSKRESHKLKKEHGDLVEELEIKLRAADREASVREDALRTEVSELRKRWQDAVRRADALSMDVQNSTAPLLRQLESMERQNRSRAAAWAELETKLRADLEDYVIDNDKLAKERNEFKFNHSRLTRISKDRDEELALCKTTLEDVRTKMEKQEAQIEEMETEGRKMKEEWSEVERLANEGVSRVRSDMMHTVLESEERHQAQQKSIENELKEEQKKRTLLERQVNELLENAGMVVVPTPSSNAANAPFVPRSVQKKLRSAESQGDILDRALSGLSDGNDEGGGDVDTDDDDDDGFEEVQTRPPSSSGMSSFAAMEQLSSRLKEAKVELEALRQSLASSERVRTSLVEELSETRVAKEKLPLFEAKVQELAIENREKEMEIMSLTEDVSEIRQLYRGQLNTLIEEKAAAMTEASTRARMSGSSDIFMTPMQSPTPTINTARIDDGSDNAYDDGDDSDDDMATPAQEANGETSSITMTSPMAINRTPSGAPLELSETD